MITRNPATLAHITRLAQRAAELECRDPTPEELQAAAAALHLESHLPEPQQELPL